MTEFHNVLFEQPEKTVFDVNDLSKVSFMNTDITRVRFSDETRWGERKLKMKNSREEKKVTEENLKIIEERL